MVTRHEFLTRLHELLQPETYLEIGVHEGHSLVLSQAPISIGVDPEPRITRDLKARHEVFIATSDQFFARQSTHLNIDLAFIDGMHLWEFAARDFLNVWHHSHAGTVVAFDDVLPYTVEMAAREQCPGDWTGDVWKVHEWLVVNFSDRMRIQLVDTDPTGILLVWDMPAFNSDDGLWMPEEAPEWMGLDVDEMPPPESVLRRTAAVTPEVALEMLMEDS